MAGRMGTIGLVGAGDATGSSFNPQDLSYGDHWWDPIRRAAQGAYELIEGKPDPSAGMPPAVRQAYYEGVAMPPDPRMAGYRRSIAEPSRADEWRDFLPADLGGTSALPREPTNTFAERFDASRPQPSVADAYRMGGLAAMHQYDQAQTTDSFERAAARVRAPFARQAQTQDIAQTGPGRAANAAIDIGTNILQLPDRLLQASQFTGMPPLMEGTPEQVAGYEAGRASVGPAAGELIQWNALPAMPWSRFSPAQLRGGVVGATGSPFLRQAEESGAAGGKAASSDLFDYSKVHDVPDVKQFDLERYAPPRGVSERVQDLTKNKKVEQKMLDMIEAGRKINAETFYYNEPLREAFVAELGKKEGSPAFQRYMDYVAATSPRSDVETNARNASYYYNLERQGLPLPDKNPQPYGHMAQELHRGNVERIRSGDYFDPVKNPKPLSFSQNLQGNFAPVTVDAHAFKLPAMLARDPEFLAGSIKLEKDVPTINPTKMYEAGDLTMRQALQRPVYWASKPNPNEYAAMEQYYKRLANAAGLTPAQTQAAAWAGGGKITGLESVAGDPFMRAVENRAIKTAAERGISPTEALSQMIRGKAPLLGVPLGAGMLNSEIMGGIAAPDNYR